MNEDFAWSEAENLIGWYAAVGTPDPQEPWRLLGNKALEERWVGSEHLLRPCPVVLEKSLNIFKRECFVGRHDPRISHLPGKTRRQVMRISLVPDLEGFIPAQSKIGRIRGLRLKSGRAKELDLILVSVRLGFFLAP